MKIELESLKEMNFDISFTGFDDTEIENYFEDDENEISEDIWKLGKHKIICGDSTLPETYKKLLGETKVNLVCTDPPYFVNLESSSGKIANDNLNDADGYEFLKKFS